MVCIDCVHHYHFDCDGHDLTSSEDEEEDEEKGKIEI